LLHDDGCQGVEAAHPFDRNHRQVQVGSAQADDARNFGEVAS
jgi:hypothetical protein